MDILVAKEKINQIKEKPKYEAMLLTASIITRLLDQYKIKPIIVGGLSVEIYTQSEYATRDIDFVSDGYHIIEDVLFSLGFKKEGRHFYHQDIEIAVEIPSNDLVGSYEKVAKVYIDDENYVYLISIEDIILDRLRAAVHWKSEEDSIWGFRLLAKNFEVLDIEYLLKQTETKQEYDELSFWIDQLKRDLN
ncbi:hypothetical protein C0966_04935 [Bacillus methanolicus]|uniref:hypothetical protein n=1 Tax=Bacillus methanolicus TaxID=1471 RepID=UPI0023801691|nr:hypothetical protein [Bacillus methanolicus]MDE3838725.1 hypothetical protein [Bacillus methanolicus]